MRRLAAAAGADVRLQIRNGFYAATAFVVALMIGAATQLPSLDYGWLLPVFVAGNLLTNTFYFVAGLVMLERAEGTIEALVVTPLRPWEYLASKTVTLVALTLAENAVIVLAVYGPRFDALALAAGIALISPIFLFCGFLAVLRHGSINDFLIPSVLYTAVLSAPFVAYLVGWESWALALHPIDGGFRFLRAAFEPVPAWRLAIGAVYAIAWTVVLWKASLRGLRRLAATGART